MRVQKALTYLARHAVLLTTAFIMLAPIIWMVSISLKPANEIFQAGFSLLPKDWHAIENYTAVLSKSNMPRFLLNGAFVTASILVLQILIAAPAAYALSKINFRRRELIFGLILASLLVPRHVIALPLFIMFHWMGLLNSYSVLILPFAVSPFGIFLLRQFFKRVPDDVVHAARLDGFSEWSIVWRIMVPMSLPAVGAFAIYSVVGHWNDLFWPLIVVRSEDLMPPALGVLVFNDQETGANYGTLMAAATLVVGPLLVVFLFAQRWFIDSMVMTSKK